MGVVGYGESIITPPVGSRMGGYAGRTFSKGIHDDLHARAVYISDGTEEVLLISTDLVGFFHPTSIRVRRLIRKHTGIKESSIVVHAVHNHAGFDTMGIFDLSGMLYERNLEIDKLMRIEGRIAEAGISAVKDAKYAKISFASVYPDKRIAINRRNPQKDIEYPINVIKFNRGTYDIYLVNYAMHATVLPRTNYFFSADYPGYVVRWFNDKGAKAIYINGPSGNVNPYLSKLPIEKLMSLPKNIRDKIIYEYPGDFEKARELGEYIALKAFNAVQGSKAEEIKNVRSLITMITIPLRYWAKKYRALNKIVYDAKIGLISTLKRMGLSNWVYADFVFRGIKSYARSEIGIIRINDIYLGALPAEFFVEYYDLFKNLFNAEKLLLAEIANDELGYVPTIDELGAGGYEEFMCFAPLLAYWSPIILRELYNKIKES